MFVAEEIDATPIAEVKRDFYNLMKKILMMYGESPEETSEQNEVTDSLCANGNC
jgi:hypothetical protein